MVASSAAIWLKHRQVSKPPTAAEVVELECALGLRVLEFGWTIEKFQDGERGVGGKQRCGRRRDRFEWQVGKMIPSPSPNSPLLKYLSLGSSKELT